MSKCIFRCAVTFVSLVMLGSANAQDMLKADAQDFEVHTKNAFGLCGNLKMLCGWESAQNDSKASLKEVKRAGGKQLVKDVLEKVVKENPRYQWSTGEGIINITPKRGERNLKNGKSPLDTVVDEFAISSVTASEAVATLCMAASIDCLPREYVGPKRQFNKISLQLKKVTVRTALNEIIKADGMASWAVEYYGKNKRPIIDVNSWRPRSGLIDGTPNHKK